MASSVSHPRRRPQKATGPSMTPSLPIPMPLRKSETFNARSNTSTGLVTPFEAPIYMPKRSPTNIKSLEDLLADGDRLNAPQQHVAKFLRDFDAVHGTKSPNGDATILNDQEVMAVPTFMVNKVSVPEPMDVDKKPVVDHHHASDSGIGTSAASSRRAPASAAHSSTKGSSRSSIATSHTAVTKSAAHTTELSSSAQHFLSEEAIRHIKQNIVRPLLKEETLKEFHPLIEDIPRRIGAKYISNLRDLEKTLFFLAPDFTSDHKSFLKFCETSIHCLQTTVDLLTERDQRRPTDPAYTNGYFCDLVEQIRRYAEIMARTREKEAAGQELDEMDYSPDEEITIEGGLSKNGKPAELVRKKNGKVIPLSDNSTLDDEDGAMALKRPLTDDEDEDEVYRSMARRRKSDRPGDIMYPCRVCDKEFKRPCDLTKHEKTHSRPWKCSEPKCRYHEMGWPTEKERDRHVNDKHSSTPTMYRCKFPPCTYASKRESNCKQHMEKAHGWEYVRSKSNGRKKSIVGSSSNRTPATPLTPFMATPASESNHLPTPDTAFEPSPMLGNDIDFGGFTFPTNYGTNSIAPAPTADELYAWDGERRGSANTAFTGTTYSTGISPDQANLSSFDDAISPDAVTFSNPMLDTTNDFNFGFTNPPMQQPTPALSAGNNFDISPLSAHAAAGPSTLPQLSPSTHHDHYDPPLYSPHVPMGLEDEGLGGGDMGMNLSTDFMLFPSGANDHFAPVTTPSNNYFGDNNFTFGNDYDTTNFDYAMGTGHNPIHDPFM